MGAAYVSAHDVPVQEANSSTSGTVDLSLIQRLLFVFMSLAKRCEEGKREGFRQREQSVVAQQGELLTPIVQAMTFLTRAQNIFFLFSLLHHFKSEESKPAPKISPAKTSEPSVNLLGLGKYSSFAPHACTERDDIKY